MAQSIPSFHRIYLWASDYLMIGILNPVIVIFTGLIPAFSSFQPFLLHHGAHFNSYACYFLKRPPYKLLAPFPFVPLVVSIRKRPKTYDGMKAEGWPLLGCYP
jgi:hypothetical protein